VNVADVAPAATDIDAGTVNTVPVLVRVTLAPPEGAALLSTTVQVEDEFASSEAGLHDTAETVVAVTKLTIVFAEVLLYAAITVEL
jgi:hypothetical protein